MQRERRRLLKRIETYKQMEIAFLNSGNAQKALKLRMRRIKIEKEFIRGTKMEEKTMANTYMEDMKRKHPDLTEDEIAREYCVIDEYKPDESCDQQPGRDCVECFQQELEEK